ncbi:hypothetical protein CBR_g4424 [Chara braunii]|nr:hypothetical protein CBR_g4424 [Chara braunii]|eukprot:GBG69594.1 hypothetical protein CBR_g4424 [Chara braunii]
MQHYNRLLEVILSSIKEVEEAMAGLAILSPSLENLVHSIALGQVPHCWSQCAYTSYKPLDRWIEDLNQRLQFMRSWINEGLPNVIWISRLCFPQALTTAVLQQYARKHNVAIDRLGIKTVVCNHSVEEIKSPPADGCYVTGLYLQNARWDKRTGSLAEARIKELFSPMGVIWLKPIIQRMDDGDGDGKVVAKRNRLSDGAVDKDTETYLTPVYRTQVRGGIRTEAVDFVTALELPCGQYSAMHWTLRGVALICSLNE